MRARTRLFALVAGVAAVVMAVSGTATGSATSPADSPSRGGDHIEGDPRSDTPAFVFDRGRFFAFDLPDEGPGEFVRMNDRGVIVGSFADDDGTLTGFKRDARGRITTFDAPNGEATPLDVNDRGWIVGNVCGTPADCGPSTRGFLRDPKGRFTRIHKQGAVRTQAYGINDKGNVVGDYLLPDGSVHGYRWRNGRFTTIDGPGGANATLTGINERGDIVGAYVVDPTDPTSGLRGFVLRKDRYRTFGVRGVRHTLPLGINNHGQVAGYTLTADDLMTGARGFVLRRGVGGPITRIDVPGAKLTAVTGIDHRGRLVGLYVKRDSMPTAPIDMLARSLQSMRTY
jgi:hypothetical protein